MTSPVGVRRLLAAAGFALAFVGAVWWAFNADPKLGCGLVAAGLVVGAGGLPHLDRLHQWQRRLIACCAIIILVFAAVELWLAIASINANRAPKLL